MQQNMVIVAKEYANESHKNNYDGFPYMLHLDKVFFNAIRFNHFIPIELKEVIYTACYLHDIVEDCSISYRQIQDMFGNQVGKLVYALTNETGERESDSYYKKIKEYPFAMFIKLCDRIANIEYSLEVNNLQKIDMYQREMCKFYITLYDDRFEEMFKYLGGELNEKMIALLNSENGTKQISLAAKAE